MKKGLPLQTEFGVVYAVVSMYQMDGKTQHDSTFGDNLNGCFGFIL